MYQSNAILAAPNGVGTFLALEGCDGVGKSSIRDVLRVELELCGFRCMIIGQHSWLNPKVARLIIGVREGRRRHLPQEVADAYFLDKRLHAEHTVNPALSSSVILADRYIISDAVYQEALYGIPAESTLIRHHQARTLFPHATIYVKVNVDEAYRRVVSRSKATKHYERPAEMAAIMGTYERVLVDQPLPFMPQLITFENDSPDWRSRVRLELVPAVLALIQETSAREEAPGWQS